MNTIKRRTVGFVDVTFGENVTVVQPVNLYGCEIGDETFIGPFVEIQQGRNDRQALPDSITCLHLRAGHDRRRLFHFSRRHVHQ